MVRYNDHQGVGTIEGKVGKIENSRFLAQHVPILYLFKTYKDDYS